MSCQIILKYPYVVELSFYLDEMLKKISFAILTVVPIHLLFLGAAKANCWTEAENTYGISWKVLYAISLQESSGDPTVIAFNKDSYDIGLMGINSWWLDKLSPFGITERRLIEDPCTNLLVGAWILRQEIDRYGYNWVAVGAYNAGAYTERTKQKKLRIYKRYANLVNERLSSISN